MTVDFGGQTVGTINTDKYGRGTLNFVVPEMPRNTYVITFTQTSSPQITNYTLFTIIPWMQSAADSPISVYVGDQVTVTGAGFAAKLP